MTDAIYGFDFGILDFIRENMTCPFMDILMGIFTRVGNYGILWIAIAVIMMFSKKYRRTGIIMAVGLVIMLITGNLLMKNLIARDRPFIQRPETWLAIAQPFGYSFPSGHSFSSFTSAAILSRRGKWWAVFSILTAVFIAFSRLYFYVHFPTDVICGCIFGLILGSAVYSVLDKRLEEKIAQNL